MIQPLVNAQWIVPPFYALKMPETEGKKAHRNAETKK